MNRLFPLVALISLLICAGCGTSNSNSGGFGGGGTSGSFSNSSLQGSYAYQITGSDLSSGNTAVPFRESGVFVADGKGNITGGEDDLAEGNSVISQNQVVPTTTGNAYSVSSDGTASLVLNFSNGGGVQLALSLVSSPTVYLVVNAIQVPTGVLTVNGTGVAALQTTSAFSAAPSGTFVFGMQNVGSLVASATVGAFTVNGGSVSGEEDQNSTGAASQLTLSGTFNPPDSMGRGTGSFTDSNNVTSPFFYYVVDTNHLYLFSNSLTTGNVGVGTAITQTGTSLAGSYAFGSSNNFELGEVNTVGQFTANSGGITGGAFDTVQGGVASLNGTFAASAYTSGPTSGRFVVNLTPSSGSPIQDICWVASPSLVFFISNDATQQAGTATLQQSSSFSRSSLSGTFGFAMDGIVLNSNSTIDLFDRAGNLHWDGAGNLGLTEFVNIDGSGQPSGILNGSYTVSSNGRVVGNVSNLSSNLVFYLVSGTQAYILQGDTGAEINGSMGTLP
jgi:hypothetical protein